MRTAEDVAVMLRLHAQGRGSKRIAKEPGISRNTVRRYLRQGGYAAYAKPQRTKSLQGLESWLRERFLKHSGRADVVRQELLSEKEIEVSLRTVERAVAPYRRELAALSRATVRFETAPGRQLQIDFGSTKAVIAGVAVRLFLYVATLGFSRRQYVQAFDHERQEAWFAGLEGAFRYFGGVLHEVLIDNARALVSRHDPQIREVAFNASFHAFANHWGFKVEVDTNHYSVPWRLMGAEVTVRLVDGRVEIYYAGDHVASHPMVRGRRERVFDRAHFEGVIRAETIVAEEQAEPELVRSLDLYEQFVQEVAS